MIPEHRRTHPRKTNALTVYEGMFLLDNDVVRAGWNQAKALVTDILEKHGATVHTARRWAERKLAYTIAKRNRATYLLVYFDGGSDTVARATREMDLRDGILRYLVLKVEAVPEAERELAEAERAPEFVVPEPPPDDQPDEPGASAEEAGRTSSESSPDDGDESDSERPSRRREPTARRKDEGAAAESSGSEEEQESVAATQSDGREVR